MKTRQHKEWFRTVSLGNRKSCPSCGSKIGSESIWSWGEYRYGKWRTVKHFCKQCWPEIAKDLSSHTATCGCEVTLTPYRSELPEWLKL